MYHNALPAFSIVSLTVRQHFVVTMLISIHHLTLGFERIKTTTPAVLGVST